VKSVRFGDLCKLQNGRAFKPEEWSEAGTPIVRIQNLNDETKPFNYCSFDVEKRFWIDSGDLLFSWSGTPGTSFGAFFWNRGKGFLNQHIFRVDVNEKLVDRKYLRYALNSLILKIIDQAHGGVGLKHITKGKLEEVQIPLPSLEAQRRIASILDKADELRQKRQQAIEKLDQLLQATFIEMFGDPVSNPKGWKIDSLNNYGSYKNGLNFGKGESGVKVLYLGVGDFKQLSRIDDVSKLSTIDLNELPSVDYFIKNGDLLFVRSNGNKELVGRCIAVYPNEKLVTYSGFCIKYRIEKSELTSSYLVHLFRAKSFKQTIFDGGQGANIQNINQQLLARLKIPIPPKDLQEKWSKILLSIEDQKQKLYKQLDIQNQLFSSLQNQAFSGNL